MCIGLDSNRAGSGTFEKSLRRDRDRVCAKFESSRRFRSSNMKPKKKSRRCRGLGLDSGLDLAISRFIYSLAVDSLQKNVKMPSCARLPTQQLERRGLTQSHILLSVCVPRVNAEMYCTRPSNASVFLCINSLEHLSLFTTICS